MPMSTMNISLPDTLKSFVDEQVSQRGFGTSSEYVRELIRKDHRSSTLWSCFRRFRAVTSFQINELQAF